jgi:hypothetical protein
LTGGAGFGTRLCVCALPTGAEQRVDRREEVVYIEGVEQTNERTKETYK